MCGIVFSKSFNGSDVTGTILKRYTAQKHRGTQGFGFYAPTTDRLTHNPKEKRILSLLQKEKHDEILFHHRFPTSTANVRNACHPFTTKDNFTSEYVAVHNGVVYNAKELRTKHEARGINYVSVQPDGKFNDSEALAYDIALYCEGKIDKLEAQGSIAFIVIKRNYENRPVTLFFGRNTSPLKIKKTEFSLTLSSEGEGEDVKPNMLYAYDYDTGVMTQQPLIIPASKWTSSYAQSNHTNYNKPATQNTPSPYTDDSFAATQNYRTYGAFPNEDDYEYNRGSSHHKPYNDKADDEVDFADVFDEDDDILFKSFVSSETASNTVRALLLFSNQNVQEALLTAYERLEDLKEEYQTLNDEGLQENLTTDQLNRSTNDMLGVEEEIAVLKVAIKDLEDREKEEKEVVTSVKNRFPVAIKKDDSTIPSTLINHTYAIPEKTAE